MEVDHVVPVGESPEGVAIDSARGVAYVANQGEDTVSLVDTATWAVRDPTRISSKGASARSDPWAILPARPSSTASRSSPQPNLSMPANRRQPQGHRLPRRHVADEDDDVEPPQPQQYSRHGTHLCQPTERGAKIEWQ
jgi:hypothetical protein